MNKSLIVLFAALALTVSTSLAICGDGRLNGNEECDGVNFLGLNCNYYNYSYGSLLCNSSCQVDRSSCYNLANATCEEVLSGEKEISCSVDSNGGYLCHAPNGTKSAFDLCEESSGLVIYSPGQGVFTGRELGISVSSYKIADIFYSLDGKKARKLCKGCDVFEKGMKYRYGPHYMLVSAEAPGVLMEKSVWFNVVRQAVNKKDSTFWYGNPVFGFYSQGYGEFKKVKTTNYPQPDLGEGFVNTKFRVSARDLPKISPDEGYAVWIFGDEGFLKLGNLKVNKKTQRSIYRTGIIGRLIDNSYEEIDDSFNGALIEVEPAGYDLPYPTTETILWFNEEPPTRFLVNGTECINGLQCQSGFCDDELCS